MRKFILFLLIFFVVTSVSAEGFKNTGLKIESFEPVVINGVKQWLLIRGNDLSRPVLLYLHGGPGESLIPFAHAATGELVKKWIVIYWEQRGTGMSYNQNIPLKTMNINQFVDDAKKVTDYLKNRFHKEKIYLLGHSWGSVLGILTVRKYPGDYYAYIGVGQVINQPLLHRGRLDWVKEQILKYGTPAEKSNLQKMALQKTVGIEWIRKYGGVVHNISPYDMYQIMRNSPYYPEKYTDELYSKGVAISGNLFKEAWKIDFLKQAPELRTPIYFFLGRYDYTTPTKPVEEYFHILKAPYKEIIWFEKSAHRMDIEEPEKFQNAIMKIAESLIIFPREQSSSRRKWVTRHVAFGGDPNGRYLNLKEEQKKTVQKWTVLLF